MTIDNECLDYARDCVRLANMADNPELREQLLKMAREWMAVAMKEDKAPELESQPNVTAVPSSNDAPILTRHVANE